MKRSLLQMLGLECRHVNKSRPFQNFRTCLECGERFKFHSYDIDASERNTIQHYVVRDRAITRTRRGVLPWRKKA